MHDARRTSNEVFMINIIVSGACGKMGSRIIANLDAQRDMRLVGAIERKGCPGLGKEAGRGVVITSDLRAAAGGADVLIEFSSPEASLEHLRAAASMKLPVVLGTTGFKPSGIAEIRRIAKRIPCVFSPNMSAGMNFLFRVLRQAAGSLKDYDVEIIEMHHNMKKDAPSGTALRLAGIVAEAIGTDLGRSGIYGRKGAVGARGRKEIGIHAVRGGDVAGDHTVIFAGQGERVELVHRASGRDAFALGALNAARFAAKAKPGLYGMEDVFNK